ncbi:MAG: cytochrome c maturation protein CcmE [Chloroflexi bacterium]|jgi:cytochrome c-type biogenesis protein CcmE|nr:cytochrome c maturation protein CcmE [Chloroflexota bacterium]MBT3670239.1 cytochrome c maturation protein CcmE [Chloroflexota bacterium]MBT4004009.1 cytochrome c maturation protein CcmE [Chloroflexota bacterium]MBT4306088.1 cytochrome c maturation protein CcmE [Chloroflexota bacterium]MBT4534467.1 cytochrome c maturation protein CcmE [Chloroflexota bacterium]
MNNKSKKIIVILVILILCGVVSGILLLATSGFSLIKTSPEASAHYYLTINEAIANDSYSNMQIRISGAVIGDSIQHNQEKNELTFLLADLPADYSVVEKPGELLDLLENVVNDPNIQTIQVVFSGSPPALLVNKAQAIMIGEIQSDGVFYADEILLKCPSRYEEAVPDQVMD